MYNDHISERILGQPVWVRQHIAELQRERDVAIRTLNEHQDEQKPSPFFFDTMVCTGEADGPTTKRKYIQTRRICVKHEKIHLEVYLRADRIELTYSECANNDAWPEGGEIAIMPGGVHQISLIHPENMRTRKSVDEKMKAKGIKRES